MPTHNCGIMKSVTDGTLSAALILGRKIGAVKQKQTIVLNLISSR